MVFNFYPVPSKPWSLWPGLLSQRGSPTLSPANTHCRTLASCLTKIPMHVMPGVWRKGESGHSATLASFKSHHNPNLSFTATKLPQTFCLFICATNPLPPVLYIALFSHQHALKCTNLFCWALPVQIIHLRDIFKIISLIPPRSIDLENKKFHSWTYCHWTLVHCDSLLLRAFSRQTTVQIIHLCHIFKIIFLISPPSTLRIRNFILAHSITQHSRTFWITAF